MFVFAYDNTAGDKQVSIDSSKTIFPRFKIENYNIEIDGRSFYDQPINETANQWNNMTKLEKYQQDKVMIIQLVVY